MLWCCSVMMSLCFRRLVITPQSWSRLDDTARWPSVLSHCQIVYWLSSHTILCSNDKKTLLNQSWDWVFSYDSISDIHVSLRLFTVTILNTWHHSQCDRNTTKLSCFSSAVCRTVTVIDVGGRRNVLIINICLLYQTLTQRIVLKMGVFQASWTWNNI